jgi:hypothetical protein
LKRRFTTLFDNISRTEFLIKRYSLSSKVKEDETSNVRSSLIIKDRILRITFSCVFDCERLSRSKKNTWSQWNEWLNSHKSFSQKYFTISKRMIDDSSLYFAKSFSQVQMKESQLIECQNSCELSTMFVISIWKFAWILEHKIMLIMTWASKKCIFFSIDFVTSVNCLFNYIKILTKCIFEKDSCFLHQLCNVNSRLSNLSISEIFSKRNTCNKSA